MNKSTAINMILEFVDNGAILEYPDQGVKYVVVGGDKEPYHAIADDIQGAMSSIEVSNRYRISITIEAL